MYDTSLPIAHIKFQTPNTVARNLVEDRAAAHILKWNEVENRCRLGNNNPGYGQ